MPAICRGDVPSAPTETERPEPECNHSCANSDDQLIGPQCVERETGEEASEDQEEGFHTAVVPESTGVTGLEPATYGFGDRRSTN